MVNNKGIWYLAATKKVDLRFSSLGWVELVSVT